MKSIILSLLVAGPVSLFAAPTNSGILLTGQQVTVTGDRTVVAGRAAAVMNDASGTRISAEQLVVENGILRGTGEVTIAVGGTTIRAQEISIEVGRKQVFVLDPNGITVGSPTDSARAFNAGGAVEKPALEFARPFPPTNPWLQSSPAGR